MIVPMKKIWVLTACKEKEHALGLLRNEGVLHIEMPRGITSGDSEKLGEQFKKINDVLQFLSETGKMKNFKNRSGMIEFVDKIQQDIDREKNLIKHKDEILHSLGWFDVWGDVDPKDIGVLKKEGIPLRLYSCNIKFFDELTDKYDLIKIFAKDKIVYFFVITEKTDNIEGCEFIEMPKVSRVTFENELTEIIRELKEIEIFKEQAKYYFTSLKEWAGVIARELEFAKAKDAMAGEEVVVLKGFVPVYDIERVKLLALREGWGYVQADPTDDDNVPTLTKNHKWISIINPVFTFMQTFPGYKEFDISLWFLIFFSIFFAMLIGDAGYGVVFATLTFIAQCLTKPNKDVFKGFILMYILAGTTIVWGAVTGTWFGAKEIAMLPGFRVLVVESINSFIDSNRNNVMYICFIIGAIHLTIAHLMKAVSKINTINFLGDIGWACVIWWLFFVVCNLILGGVVPVWSTYMGIAGVGLILIFSNFQKNMFKGMLLALADLPLSIIGAFSDIVSYIRLFAVGAASVAMASTFNSMALANGVNNILAGFIAAFVLFLGHGLNIVLGLMAVLVHGIRLNMLEFSGHLDMQWSGHEYKPFK